MTLRTRPAKLAQLNQLSGPLDCFPRLSEVKNELFAFGRVHGPRTVDFASHCAAFLQISCRIARLSVLGFAL
jgi:hypothetical protein